MTTNPTRNEHENPTTPQSAEPIEIPSTVYEQLDALRRSGVANMFTEVRAGLERFGFTEARQWIQTHPEAYAHGISNGFTPTDPSTVDPIDPEMLADAVPEEVPGPKRTDASTVDEEKILQHLESIQRLSPQAATYYNDGSWRETASLTPEERELVDLFQTAVDCKAQQCYRNAMLLTASFGSKYDVAYVEGHVMSDSLVSPLAHAWVELNEKVIELTLPEGPEPETGATYFGMEFPYEEVKSKIFDDGIAEPLAHAPLHQQ